MESKTLWSKIKEFFSPYVFDLFIWLSPFEKEDDFWKHWCPIYKQNEEYDKGFAEGLAKGKRDSTNNFKRGR